MHPDPRPVSLTAKDGGPEDLAAGADQPRARPRSTRTRLAFLQQASDVLGASLDYETTLQNVARLAVPRLADGCVIDLLDEDGITLVRAGVAHVDPAREAALLEAPRRSALHAEPDDFAARAVRAGRTELVSGVVDEAALAAMAHSPERKAVRAALSVRCAIATPLRARHGGRVFGVLSLANTDSARRLTEADVPVAEGLAHQAALALENARLHHAVAAERDRLRQVLDVLPEGVLITDAAGRVRLANAAARALLGDAQASLSPAESGTDAYEVRRTDGTPLASRELPMARTLTHGEVVHGEQVLLRQPATGADLELLMNSAPLHDTATGRLDGAVAVFQDVSALHDLSREKDTFLAAVSHDLRNPLTVIRGYAELLQRHVRRSQPVSRERLLDGLGRIEATANRVIGMMTELLDVARLDMGRPIELATRPMDLVALVRRVVADEEATSSRSVRFRVRAEEPALVGEWDPGRLERVVTNLVANASRYSRAGGEVEIAVAPRQHVDEANPPARWALLTVRDTGVGIPAREQALIFERFYRGSNVAGHIAGTGVGLAGSRQIVEQHGGYLWVESEEGVGSTFSLLLPPDPPALGGAPRVSALA